MHDFVPIAGELVALMQRVERAGEIQNLRIGRIEKDRANAF
jgi:hypothetical protein